MSRLLVLTEYNGVELALLTSYSPFVVRLGAVIINRIALAEDFYVVADLHLELSAYDDIELLTLVGMGVRNAEFLVYVGDSYEEGLAYLVSEFRSKTEVAESLSSCNGKSLAGSCDIKAVDTRRFALHEVSYLDAADICELIYKSEAEILGSALVCEVFIRGNADLLSHFLGRQTYRFAGEPYSLGDLSYFKLRIYRVYVHCEPAPFCKIKCVQTGLIISLSPHLVKRGAAMSGDRRQELDFIQYVIFSAYFSFCILYSQHKRGRIIFPVLRDFYRIQYTAAISPGV